MKVKLMLFSLVLTGSIFLFTSTLMALGLGVYGTTAKAGSTWRYNEDEVKDSDVDADVSKLGWGFILDTTIANDRLFNYRLNIGYSKTTIENKTTVNDIEGKNYHLYNSFGFGVLRSELVRIWLGPQVGVGWMRGEYDSVPSDIDNRFTTIYFSFGLVAGVNFNIGEVVAFAFDGGYRINRHGGAADIGNNSYGITGTEKEGFLNLSFLLRINDIFE